MAAWACAAGFRIDEIRHSGKTRAAQTADAFAQRLHPAPPSIAASGLDPNDDVRPVGEQLRRESKTVMLVGHLPFLSRLVGYLVAGDPDQEVVLFEASSLVVLSREDSQWLVACAMRPDLL
jgi:phosphohistidine phosphatase